MSEKEKVREAIFAKLRENPHMSYKKLASEVRVSYFLARRVALRFKEEGTVKDKARSGRPKHSVNKQLERRVIGFIERNPNMSIRDIAKKAKTSHQQVINIKKRNNIKTYKKKKIPKRSEKQNVKSKKLAGKLYREKFVKKNVCIVMDDETYVKMDFSTLPGPQYYSVVPGCQIGDDKKTIGFEKFGKKLLIWQAICQCGNKSRIFVTEDTIGADIYIKECLQKRLLPFITNHDGNTLFWPDLAPAHYANKTLKWYGDNGINYVPKDTNPPNVPELRPIERYWAKVKAELRKSGKTVKTKEELKKFWKRASDKVNRDVVQNLMEGIVRKTRAFSRRQ